MVGFLPGFLLLSGCAAPPRQGAEVTVAHRLAAPPQLAYRFVRADWQQGSAEHELYEGLIRTGLAQHGFQESGQDTAAAVYIHYTPADKQQIVEAMLPVLGFTGVPRSGAEASRRPYPNIPAYGIVGLQAGVNTSYVFRLELKIVEHNAPTPLYQGEVLGFAAQDQRRQVLAAMIKLLFAEFPGNSGSRRWLPFSVE